MDTSLTYFAPAEREPLPFIQGNYNQVRANDTFGMILDALPDSVLLLNERRQIVFTNQAASRILGFKIEDILGTRPGELVSCIHAGETAGGCGTSPSCQYCGAVNAILIALNSDDAVDRDCRISVEQNGKVSALDLLVTAKKIQLENNYFILFTIKDISDANRRKVLERVFFHDVINSIAALQSGANLLKEDYGDIGKEYLEPMLSAVEYLLEEVLKQRDLVAMERGDLAVQEELLSTRTILSEVITLFSASELARGKQLMLADELSVDEQIFADPVLLRRVIVNMVKNALEASAQGEVVLAWTQKLGDRVRFSVQNPSLMPDAVKAQVFQRSFSTKGAGRGLGTYSMHMLTEDYLHGEISFSSIEGEGTIFWIDLPLPT